MIAQASCALRIAVAIAIALVSQRSLAEEPVTLDRFLGTEMPFDLGRLNFFGFPSNPEAFAVAYSKTRDADTLRIQPSIPYLNIVRGQRPITGVAAFSSVFSGESAPELEFLLNNSTSKNILITTLVIDVGSSARIDEVIPVFHAFPDRNALSLTNYGFGEITKAHLQFTVESLEDCKNRRPKKVTLKDLWLERDPEDSDRFRGQLTDADIPSALSNEPLVCVAGFLDCYSAGAKVTRFPFATAMNRVENPPYAAPPLSATYQVKLEAGRSNYRLEVPISQSLAPQSADYFKIRVTSDRSAMFKARLALRTSEKKLLDLGRLDLEYFRPKGVRPELDPSMFSRVDVKVRPQLQHYVRYVGQNPEDGEEFVVAVTSEFAKTATSWSPSNGSDNDWDNLRADIETALSRSRSKAHYCFTTPDGECIGSGGFGYR